MRISAVVACVVLAVSHSASAQEDVAAVGQAAPNFRLPAYNGPTIGMASVGLDRFVGYDAPDKNVKSVLVSFMASYCGPCKKELPYLQALHEKYNALGLRVLSVSIDTDAEGQSKIEELIVQNKVTFPVLKDRFNLVARRWLGQKTPLPSLFFIRPDGVIASIHRGYDQDASVLLAKEVEAALGVKPDMAVLSPPPVAAAEPPKQEVKENAAPTAAAAATPSVAKGKKGKSVKAKTAKKPSKSRRKDMTASAKP